MPREYNPWAFLLNISIHFLSETTDFTFLKKLAKMAATSGRIP